MTEWVLGHPPSVSHPKQQLWSIIQTESLLEDLQLVESLIAVWHQATDLLWTSREAIAVWKEALKGWKGERAPSQQRHWCVGKGTAERACKEGFFVAGIAEREQAEGLAELLLREDLSTCSLLWMHAEGSRLCLRGSLQPLCAEWCDVVIYRTCTRLGCSPPPTQPGDTLLFTSPTCVRAWHDYGWSFPEGVRLAAIGPITAEALYSTGSAISAFSAESSSSGS
jgi:uroporphyrinogen-III synthase